MHKSIIRKSLLIKRSKVKNRSQKESNIFKKLKTIINNNSLVVAGYLSVKSEVNLSLFLNFLLRKKFSLCLPYIKRPKSSLFFNPNIDNNSIDFFSDFNLDLPIINCGSITFSTAENSPKRLFI